VSIRCVWSSLRGAANSNSQGGRQACASCRVTPLDLYRTCCRRLHRRRMRPGEPHAPSSPGPRPSGPVPKAEGPRPHQMAGKVSSLARVTPFRNSAASAAERGFRLCFFSQGGIQGIESVASDQLREEPPQRLCAVEQVESDDPAVNGEHHADLTQSIHSQRHSRHDRRDSFRPTPQSTLAISHSHQGRQSRNR
jgi:hypothetical protein